jgi:hypothetical protein
MEQAARTRAAELGRSNAVLSTRQRMLEAAVETSDALLAAIDVEEAIGGVLARLGVVLDADRALLIRFDPRPRTARWGGPSCSTSGPCRASPASPPTPRWPG